MNAQKKKMTDTTQYYIVPINVQGVRVTESDRNRFKGATVDFSNAGNGLGVTIDKQLAGPNSSSPINEGVHLHWALPDAITHAYQGPDGNLEFPSAPNRWLVTRYLCEYNTAVKGDGSDTPPTDNLAQPMVRQWIIESNKVNKENGLVKTYPTSIFKKEGNSPTLPTDKEGVELDSATLSNLVENFLGSRTAYDSNWKDEEPEGSADSSAYDPAITVISYYGPSFGAYYQNCATTFGLHDDLEDYVSGKESGYLNVANFSVSYQVIGWYSKPEEHDVLMMTLADAKEAYQKLTGEEQAKTTIQAFLAQTIEQELKWQLNAPGDSQEWPTHTRSIYNGMALNIQWLTGTRADQHSSFLPPPQEIVNAASLELAIGNNSAEAMSALISKKNIVNPASAEGETQYPEVEENVELLFNAFQQDLLRKLKGTDLSLRLPELEEYLHSARFAGRKGGSLWSVHPEQEQSDQTLKASSSAEVGLPLAAAEILSLLNNTQREYDKEIDALHSRQHQAYLDYTSYGVITQKTNDGTEATSPDDSSTLQAYLTSELLKIYSESAKTGRIEETGNAEGKAAFTFKPTWTFTNKKAEEAILHLSAAQGTWWFLYPQTIGLIGAITAEAQASFLEGNYSNARSFLQQINQAPLGQVVKDLSSFFNKTSNPLFNEIDRQIDSLQGESKNLATIFKELQHVQEKYTTSPFGGHQAIKKLLPECKEVLFTATNLMDFQQIYVELEAVAHYSLSLPAVGARLKEAIAIAQKGTTDIATAIKNLQSLKSLLRQNFESDYLSLTTISQNVSEAISKLASGELMDDTLIQQIIGHISIINKRVAAVLANEPTRTAQGLQIATCWQMILDYLPTGHQVIVMVNAVKAITSLIDINNKLSRNPAETFWAPNEPVLLITEPKGAENILVRVNRNGKSNLLPCRQHPELISALQLNTTNITANELGATAVAKAYGNTGDLQVLIQSLLNEGYFLTPQASYDLIANAAKLGNDSLTLDLITAQIDLVKQQEKAQFNERMPAIEKDKTTERSVDAPLATAFKGTPSYYIGMTDLWKGDIDYTPFLPLFLAWSADFNPVQLVDGPGADQKNSVIPPDYITSNFKLGANNVDIVCSKPLQLQQQNGNLSPVKLYGQITLSNQASYALLQQISIYFKKKGIDISSGNVDTSGFNSFEKELYDAFEYFDKKVILSQGMNGFNSGLLEQLQLLQLPVNGGVAGDDNVPIQLLDFLIPFWRNPEFDKTTVGQYLNSNYFLPLRAGMLQMKELYIVDAFGRYFQIGDIQNNRPVQDQLIVSSSMKAGPEAEQNNNEIYLPPRFVQPMQLSFDWLSSTSLEGGETTFVERTQQPAFSPVCGWILPNNLDNSLSLYDGSGEPLGSLGIEGLKHTATWRPVPSGEPGDSSDNGRNQMQADIANANPFFRDFLNEYAFPVGGASYFQEFLNIIEQSQVYIHSANLQQEKGLAVLVGRPLVLVRAELRLDLQGLPEVGLKESFFKASAKQLAEEDTSKSENWLDYDIDKRFQAGLTDVVCPVQLGDLHQFDDGLIGFFLNDDWSTFFSPIASSKSGAVQQSTFETIVLRPNYHSKESALVEKGSGQNNANKEQKSVIVTMLMDPRADVHATTGILPVQSINIPSDQYATTLNKLLVYFLANPVLMGDQQIDLPLPKERGYDWAWAQPGVDADLPLSPNYINDNAQFNYSPQTIRDGWLKLKKAKK